MNLIFAILACTDPAVDDSSSPPEEELPTLPEMPDVYAALGAVEGLTIHDAYQYQGDLVLSLTLRQPVDHANPDGATFDQWLTLRIEDPAAPTVLLFSGYADQYGSYQEALTQGIGANQISVEKRYNGYSLPEGEVDWTTLNTEQVAADNHAIVEALKPTLTGPWINHGGSLGGLDSLYHRMHYPDDVAGTVALVAPAMASIGDTRSLHLFDDFYDADCQARLEALQIVLLTPEADGGLRETLMATAEEWGTNDGLTYERAGSVDAAVEEALVELPFTFWQTDGSAGSCEALPDPAGDSALVVEWALYSGGYYGFSDQQIEWFTPWFYQVASELGYPALAVDHLEGLVTPDAFTVADWLPTGAAVPEFKSSTPELQAWLTDEADDVVLVYGESDPLTAFALSVEGAKGDVDLYTVAGGNHYSGAPSLSSEDRAAFQATLDAWLSE